MPITQTLPDGRQVILDGAAWRELTPEEQSAGQSSRLDAFSMGLLRNAAGYAGLAGDVLLPITTMGAVQPGANPLSQWAGQMGQSLQPVATMQPGASAASAFWADPFNLASTMALAEKGFGMASRVSQGINSAGQSIAGKIPSAGEGQKAAQQAASGLDEMGLPLHQSAGAAATDQGPRTFLERLTDEFTTPIPLTDQQKAARQAVTDGWVKFQPLPGQFSGSRLMNSGIKSNPLWLSEFEPELVGNYRSLTGALKQGLGLPEGTPFTDELTSLADEALGARYDAVQALVKEDIQLPGHVRHIAEKALTPMEKGLIDLSKPLPAEQIFQIRRDISALTRQLAKDGDITGIRASVQAIDAIDEALLPHIGDAGKKLFQDTNARFRLKLLLDSGSVVSPSGQVNLASAYRAGRTIFRKQFAGFGPRAGLPEDVSKALDAIKVAAAFPDAVGNSGTAERLASMEMLTNPTKYAKAKAVGKAIRYLADQTPPPAVTGAP